VWGELGRRGRPPIRRRGIVAMSCRLADGEDAVPPTRNVRIQEGRRPRRPQPFALPGQGVLWLQVQQVVYGDIRDVSVLVVERA
jgi:hypothetical protein